MNRYEQWLADLEAAMASIPLVTRVLPEPGYAPEGEQRPAIAIVEGEWPIANSPCGCWSISGAPIVRVLANTRADRGAIVRDVIARLMPGHPTMLSLIKPEGFGIASILHKSANVSGGAFVADINLDVVIKCKRYALDQAP